MGFAQFLASFASRCARHASGNGGQNLAEISAGPTNDSNQQHILSTDGDAEYDKLITLMYVKLPQELLDKIKHMLFESAFCPGFVFPHQQSSSTDTILWKGRSYDKVKPQLLSISKTILAKYERRMWDENTFVIGDMPYDKGNTIPGEEREPQWPSKRARSWWSRVDLLDPRSRVERLENHLLYHLWVGKGNLLGLLVLDEVTLDFTECYGPRANWLGDKFADFPPLFMYKRPDVLNVIAPDEEKRELLYRKIMANNVW
ncbi:MAG: hypothetical protein Q9226_006609 [Calogaya cf. arnoldii]